MPKLPRARGDKHIAAFKRAGWMVNHVGFWEVHRFLAQWVAGRQKKVSAASLRKAPLIMVALTILILLPKSLKLQGEDKIPVKQAGLWIKAQQSREDARPLIMAHEPLIAYYAAGSYLPVPPLPYSEFVAFVRRAGVDYVVFDNDELEKKPGFAGSLRDGHFRPATARFPGMSVYEVVQ